MSLSNNQKRHLRSLAHGMAPLANIGGARVSDAVVRHVDELLEARELVKVKLLDAEREEVEEARATLSERCRADVVQVIGGTLVLYRRHHTEPKIALPKR
jgi:RNA-binding protein